MALVAVAQQATPLARPQYAGRFRSLLAWRAVPCFGWIEAIALTLFFAIGAYTLRFHEAWDDEAQSWLIARDNTAWQIVRYRAHYEGTPPLWHLTLHLFHVLGGTYTGIGWLSLAFATMGMFVWLRWSPFPPLLRFLLPYTFFPQYQYAVIARSYVMFALLVFTLCVLYTRPRAIVWFAFLDGLLANLSAQGFTIALAFAALYLFDRLRRNRAVSLRKLRSAAAIFAVLASTAIYCAIPAPDLNFGIGEAISGNFVHPILMKLIGATPRNAPRPTPEPPIILPEKTIPPPTWSHEPKASLTTLIFPPVQPTISSPIRWLIANTGPKILEATEQIAWPISESNLLACAFIAAIILWLRSRKRLRMLWLWLGVLAAGQILWLAEHHVGMLIVALMAACWLAFDTGTGPIPDSPIERTFLAVLALVFTLQIGWSIACIHADVQRSYDPGPETAQWLKAHPQPRMAAFGFATVSIQPWFQRSPFFDVPTSWWQWSSNIEVDGIHRSIIATYPDVVVYGLEFPGYGPLRNQVLPVSHISLDEERDLPRDLIVRDLRDHGYRETHRFCGTRFSRFSSAYRVCDMIFEPAPPN